MNNNKLLFLSIGIFASNSTLCMDAAAQLVLDQKTDCRETATSTNIKPYIKSVDARGNVSYIFSLALTPQEKEASRAYAEKKANEDLMVFTQPGHSGGSLGLRCNFVHFQINLLSPYVGTEFERVQKLRLLVDSGFMVDRNTSGSIDYEPAKKYTMLELVLKSLDSQLWPPFPDSIDNHSFVPACLALGSNVVATVETLMRRANISRKRLETLLKGYWLDPRDAHNELINLMNHQLLNTVFKVAVSSNFTITNSPKVIDQKFLDPLLQLLKGGAQITTKDTLYGMTPFIWAAALDCLPLVELLFSRDSKQLFMPDGYGATALHCAARNGHSDIVRALLNYAGDRAEELSQIKDINEKTAEDYAQMHNRTRVLGVFRDFRTK